MFNGLLGMIPTSVAAVDMWEMKSDMPTARWGLATCVVDGIIYALGGTVNPNNPLSTVEAYDPSTDTWTQKADMPTPKYWFSASVVDGKIYVIGGAQREWSTALSVMEEYDPATDTWITKTDIPTRRLGHSASVVDGIIYVIGGLPSGDVVNVVPTVEAYDPATDTWTRKADMPTKRLVHSACVVDGKIYAIGGGNAHWITLQTVEEYDPATDTWTKKADLPEERGFLGTSVVDGIIYAVGGTPSYETWSYASVEAYNPKTDSWTAKPEMSVARTALSTSVVNGKIYAIGGTSSIHTLSATYATVEEYDLNPLVVDFNGDGKVDIEDLLRLIESWGTDDPMVDIGPLAFGDGIVDASDLEVLMSYWDKVIDDPTLMAHWALDEAEADIAYDSTGQNEAFVIGGPVWQPDGGQIGGALELDGVDDCLIVGSGLIMTDKPFSVFAWVKGGESGQGIISQPNGADWLVLDNEGRLMTGLKGTGRSAVPLLSQAIITDNQWHRIGLVCDGSQRMLFVDGVIVAEDTQNSLGTFTSGLYVGVGKNYTPGTFFSGLIDDVRIYNRVVSP